MAVGMLVSLMICVLWIMRVYGVGNLTIITGMVFCDTCKDGVVSLHDYPLSGISVTMVCPGVDSPTHFKTGNFEIYGVMFEGTPKMGKCNALVSLRNNNSFCMASTRPSTWTEYVSNTANSCYNRSW